VCASDLTPASGAKSAFTPPKKAGDIVKLGGIDWRVLEIKDGKALVITDKVMMKGMYHSVDMVVPWEKCALRDYLNGEFYDTAFLPEEKQRIVQTNLVNKENTWLPEYNPSPTGIPRYGMPAGANTTDKVFLLSIEEVLQYFGDSGTYIEGFKGGAYFLNDQFNNKRVAETPAGNATWWWLRSPGLFYNACGYNFKEISCVAASGSLALEGELINNKGGIRPAMWLSL
jgi:hypothetical protein